ncbi:putative metalloendopeptidase [Rhypophila decipiens]|uniref:Metalloendopeptidase n=1 Tax=Rhypophila decipiens TaxID=261697 RepID=A0AAN7B588_9PEZI|nr:putative metalloendopeptidase [Rhypophila decipiens]
MSEKGALLGVAEPQRPGISRCQRFRRNAVVFLFYALSGLTVIQLIYMARNHIRPTAIRPVGPAVPSSSEDICMTPACVHAASEILYNLSPNYKDIDPCTDFEELVCGGWRERHDLRPDQGDAFTGTTMSENSQQLLRHILAGPYPNASHHSSFSPMRLAATSKSADEANFEKLAAAYDACLDEKTIEKLDTVPLTAILNQIIMTFPLEEPKSINTLAETVLLLAQYGVSALISPSADADDTDPDVVVVKVFPPWTFGLPAQERYEDDALVAKYKDVVAETLGQLMPDQTRDVLDAVVDFEKKLAAASPNVADRLDVTKTYNPMSLKEASDLTPKIDLSRIISALGNGQEVNRLIVASPKYMKDLQSILDETDRRVLQSYFLWKAVQAFYQYVSSPLLKPYKRFENVLAGKAPESEPERWRTCVNHVDDGLGWILSRFFVEKAFSADAKKFGDQIVSDIKDLFVQKLKNADWMDDKTTSKAIEKVHNIIQKIGYPTESPNIMDPESLAAFYRTVNISPDTYFANALQMSSFAVTDEWSALGKPVDRNRWGMSVPTVNAYYNPPGNEIVFPAGIMQFPVFDVDVPAYLSYGAFGSVAGHELSHAFDSTGRHYDQNGNLTDWWTNTTVKAFEERAECFVDQYANFSIPGPDGKRLHVNGKLTLGENIADAGGLSASFQAWKIRAKEKANAHLPGLSNFSQEQLFFVSYANWWCGTSTLDTAINRIYMDPHAPKWARVLGTMANSREFRESFECKSEEPTCALW